METIKLKRVLTQQEGDALKGKFLTDQHFTHLINYDCDAYDLYGNLLFKFRKNIIPFELLKLGYESFKDAIVYTTMRGTASGESKKFVNKKGKETPVFNGDKVMSSLVGYSDKSLIRNYCRKTAFTQKYFEKFQMGVPFVEYIDRLYEELCPVHYKRQKAIATGTNRNYVIADTAFTTVTVNKNFATAVHKDTGDFTEGFGNLIVYKEGNYDGSYFCLPEYAVAIDLQNTDILFVDVHRWHGNTPFKNMSEDYMRISFVMYYREYMYKCKSPSDELKNAKIKNGYYTL